MVEAWVPVLLAVWALVMTAMAVRFRSRVFRFRSGMRSAERRFEEARDSERARRTARWVPSFSSTSYGSSLEIELQRRTGSGLVVDRLSIGEVSTEDEGWEEALDALVISARARMASLNAFIDSYADAPMSEN